MKKSNLFAFASLLALSGLTNCGGKNFPTKPDVYFRAQAAIINADGTKEKADFKDDECATIAIDDKENLKYGEKDVVIHIKPKNNFFTFREYDVDTWEPTSTPVHPYVGLGNPHTLYSYPLQENVAWTFKDVSEKIGDFYKEEYVITVKKDFFQKNIVIDYGNVGGLDKSIYLYNSVRYENYFRNALSGNYSNLYQYESKYSAFYTTSKGATITYGFKSGSNTPFSFSGWDNPPTFSEEETDPVEYPNFKVYGYKNSEKTNKVEKTNLAVFDPNVGKKDQAFVPSVVTEGETQYLSFFIKWEKLAKTEAPYDCLYDGIEVELGKPTPFRLDNVTHPDDVTVFPCDYFEHPTSQTVAPFYLDGTLHTWTTNDKKQEISLEFNHVLPSIDNPLEEGRAIQYSTLFMMPEGNEEYFHILIDGGKAEFCVDLKYHEQGPEPNRTEGRAESGIEGEADLNYWESAGGWRLIQLNPEDRTAGLPDDFKGNNNLYYLYTDSTEMFKGMKDNLEISIEFLEEPPLSTFKLDNSSKTYGTFKKGETELSLNCVGDANISLDFYFDTKYRDWEFEVEVSSDDPDYSGEFSTRYVSGEYNDHATICISKQTATFVEDETLTITLVPPATKISITESTFVIGNLIDESGYSLGCEYNPTINDQQNAITFYFQFIDPMIMDDTNNLSVQVLYNNTALSVLGATYVWEAYTSVENSISVTVTLAEGQYFDKFGDILSLSVSYFGAQLQQSEELATLRHAEPLGQYVAQALEELYFDLVFSAPAPEANLASVDSNVPGFVGSCEMTKTDDFTYTIHVLFNYTVEYPGILNGNSLTITVEYES